MPRPEVAGAELSEEPIAEDVVAAGQEESATEQTAADDSGRHDTLADGESAPALPDGDAEASLSESDAGGADAPPAERDGQTEPGEGAEQQQRRVVLQAGTDEESLKALALCREKVTQLRLRMHPLAARWESDRHVIIFFRADEKVDFRKLVRELSHLLHARIELRQVGPREQGKLCGLVGKCGYPLCCQTFLGQFAQSTIKMAKTQELALNPMKISGVCGRLLCCLNYEQQMYLDARANMPRVNKIVDTEFGPGRVVAVNVLKQTVTVQLETATRELRPEQILPPQPQG
jgi:cell fate regulator YaaT (PSP1 superfamily)